MNRTFASSVKSLLIPEHTINEPASHRISTSSAAWSGSDAPCNGLLAEVPSFAFETASAFERLSGVER